MFETSASEKHESRIARETEAFVVSKLRLVSATVPDDLTRRLIKFLDGQGEGDSRRFPKLVCKQQRGMSP